MEIFTNNEGAIILKKYSPIGELGSFAKQYAESLSQVSGHVALIADRDQFIAAAGSNRKQILGKNVSKELEEKMNSRETVCASRGEKSYIGVMDNEVEEYQHEVIIPIITQGDIIGAVVLLSTNEGDDMRSSNHRKGHLWFKAADALFHIQHNANVKGISLLDNSI